MCQSRLLWWIPEVMANVRMMCDEDSVILFIAPPI